MTLTTDNRPLQIAEDYFEEIKALRNRMRQLETENAALRRENHALLSAEPGSIAIDPRIRSATTARLRTQSTGRAA
jgi:hypothetical protein